MPEHDENMDGYLNVVDVQNKQKNNNNNIKVLTRLTFFFNR
jgi:heme-degrading monooxygenase HmoA